MPDRNIQEIEQPYIYVAAFGNLQQLRTYQSIAIYRLNKIYIKIDIDKACFTGYTSFMDNKLKAYIEWRKLMEKQFGRMIYGK